MEEKLKQHDERMQDEIQQRVATTINEMIQSGALPVDPNITISPSQHRSSCASTEVPEENTEENTAILPVDNQRYPVDDICQRTSCELHRPFGNITIKVYISLIHAIS